jgi:hypothetical protein
VSALFLLSWLIFRHVRRDQDLAWERFLRNESSIPVRRAQPLSAEELRWAHAAWQYFERHTSRKTGLPLSYAGAETVTVGDVGAYVLATIAAHRLGIIGIDALNERMGRLLDTLSRLPLFEDALPNHIYHATTLRMIGREGNVDLLGTGWSAIDISRLLLGFHLACWEYPYLTPQIRDILGRWRLDLLVKDGFVQGAHVSRSGRVFTHREGRLGYEEYAARVLSYFNLYAGRAADLRSHVALTRVEGVALPYDTRPLYPLEGLNVVSSDPFLLHGLELGLPGEMASVAYHAYRVQWERFVARGEPVAVGGGYLGTPPERILCALVVDNRTWDCVDEAGHHARNAFFFSAGAALGWAALFEAEYATALRRAAAPAHDPRLGWRTGHYLRDAEPIDTYTTQTNALVLEATHFVLHGPMFDMTRGGTDEYWSHLAP